jgi:hypothetical protein
MEKCIPKKRGYFCNFQKTAQRKQSPIRRKFAPSGHHGGKSGAESADAMERHLAKAPRSQCYKNALCGVRNFPGTEVMIFKYSRKKIGDNLSFLTQNKAKLCKYLIMTLVFEKNAIFAKKLAKIAKNCYHNIDPRNQSYVCTTSEFKTTTAEL